MIDIILRLRCVLFPTVQDFLWRVTSYEIRNGFVVRSGITFYEEKDWFPFDKDASLVVFPMFSCVFERDYPPVRQMFGHDTKDVR